MKEIGIFFGKIWSNKKQAVRFEQPVSYYYTLTYFFSSFLTLYPTFFRYPKPLLGRD